VVTVTRLFVPGHVARSGVERGSNNQEPAR
jgi:hypothetical protein